MSTRPSTAWVAGWAAGGAVVVVAAGLLQTITTLARRLSTQSGDIVASLDATAANTAALWHVDDTNALVHRITRGLLALGREAGAA